MKTITHRSGHPVRGHGGAFSLQGTPSITVIYSGRIALNIKEELILLMNKNAGMSADAFDIITTIWSQLRDYRESLVYVLDVIYLIYLA